MKLGQIRHNNVPMAAIFENGQARVIRGHTALDVVKDPTLVAKATAPEPELAVVIGPGNTIFGYTLANDVSAWDIERENALYLTQSKVYDRCCALGPVILTADSVPDPYCFEMTCTLTRNGKVFYEG